MCGRYSQVLAFITVVTILALSTAKPLSHKQSFHKLSRRSTGLQIRSIGSKTSTKKSVRIQCKNLLFLQIRDDGAVNGSEKPDSPYVKLQLQSAGPHGLVRIYSIKTKRYIAMNSKGKVYSTLTPADDTVFKYALERTGYHTFASRKHVNVQLNKPMFLALRHSGQAKKGTKTTRWHRSSQFLELK